MIFEGILLMFLVIQYLILRPISIVDMLLLEFQIMGYYGIIYMYKKFSQTNNGKIR